METEKKLLQEYDADKNHEKALAVCELLTECKSLKTALTLQQLPAVIFYRMRREHKDVQQAWQEAQEILADIKMSSLSELNDRLIDEEGLTVGTFTAVTKNERWLVEKLSPDRYGARPQPQQAFVQNNVQILQQLTDEQIIKLAGVTPQVDNLQKTLDTPAEIDYIEHSSGNTATDAEHVESEVSSYHSISSLNKCQTTPAATTLDSPATQPTTQHTTRPTTHPTTHPTTQPTIQPTTQPTIQPTTRPATGGYDLSAFGDII